MPQIVYDLKGYPQFVYTAQDFAEQKARKQPDINQLANLLIRSIFEDGGLGRVLSIDEVTPGTPANGWTIRFTGETNGRTADPYIATYDGQAISYNDDPSRQPRDLSEGLALALEFTAKKDGKNCNKGKPCGGSCIAKGRNCLRDKKDLSKNQQQAADAIAKAEPVGALVLAKQALAGGTKGKDSRKSSGGSDVDSRYASANPTDEQAKKFLKDKTAEFLGSPKTDRKEAIKEVHGQFKKTKVKDRKTYVQAVLRNQEISIQNWDRDGQSWMADNKSKIKRVESRLADAKTDKARKRAQSDLDKLLKEKTELEAGLRNIEELRKKPQEQRIAEAEQRYERDIKQAAQDRAERRAAYQRGDKATVTSVDREVRDNLIKPMLDDPDSEDYTPARNILTGRVEQPSVVEQAKAYLRLVHRRDGGDISALGLGKGKPSLNDLRRAYRKKAAETHPDRGGSREAFEAVRGSYERLMKQYYPEQVDMMEFDLSGAWMVRQLA